MESTGFDGGFQAVGQVFSMIYDMLSSITIGNSNLLSIIGVGFLAVTTLNLIFRSAWGVDP